MKEFYDLSELRNWREITRGDEAPIRLGVFGDPVAHSLSPPMQNAALSTCGIDARYARFRIAQEELAEAIQLVRDLGFIGVNLTIPHKIIALEFINSADVSADVAGAVNTMSFGAGTAVGFNTDGSGFVDAVAETWPQLQLSDTHVLVLGVGGAGKAIAAECARVGCARLTLFNRSPSVASRLAEELAMRYARCRIDVADSLGAAAAQAQLIVNATSVGLREDDAALLPREAFHAGHFVYDTIYQPPLTRFLSEAKAAGAETANGLSMLLHQGAKAFEIWFGRPAPLEVMRRALYSAAELA